jgi:hypothetical protein
LRVPSPLLLLFPLSILVGPIPILYFPDFPISIYSGPNHPYPNPIRCPQGGTGFQPVS